MSLHKVPWLVLIMNQQKFLGVDSPPTNKNFHLARLPPGLKQRQLLLWCETALPEPPISVLSFIPSRAGLASPPHRWPPSPLCITYISPPSLKARFLSSDNFCPPQVSSSKGCQWLWKMSRDEPVRDSGRRQSSLGIICATTHLFAPSFPTWPWLQPTHELHGLGLKPLFLLDLHRLEIERGWGR